MDVRDPGRVHTLLDEFRKLVDQLGVQVRRLLGESAHVKALHVDAMLEHQFVGVDGGVARGGPENDDVTLDGWRPTDSGGQVAWPIDSRTRSTPPVTRRISASRSSRSRSSTTWAPGARGSCAPGQWSKCSSRVVIPVAAAAGDDQDLVLIKP